MIPSEDGGVHAAVNASPGRRLFACLVLYLLGGLLVYTALAKPPALHWLVLLLFVGAVIFWLAENLRRATRVDIVLTDTDLRDTSGFVLARIADIKHVDRSALALKPANGFTLVMNTHQSSGWAPGMWWRFGRRVGVGGVTAAGQAKFMAEQIALRLIHRDAQR